ncbi:hypothetical protein [Croceibacterium ferulae]|uniref:hypothetical protein n=1 Tax=Croceibacterium ferulae TaxID=1854641 RepID=UPI000EAF7513|nr:hypothetical protein [Croceibacterium ferulae]
MTVRRAALLLAPAVLAMTLSACGGGQSGGLSSRAIAQERRRPPLRANAQPTSVIAAEIALARAAREEGQWLALANRATPGAQIAWNGAAMPAASWLAGRASPATPDRWQAREAWASCDGSAVVVAGLGHDATGNWSRFTRVWERQRDNDFRWSVTVWQPDPDLTRTRREDAAQRAADNADDAIVVEALNMIRARVVPCTRPTGRETGPAASGAQPGLARDGTLRWTPAPDIASGFTAWWQGAEGWEPVHTQLLTAGDGA